MVLKDKRPYWMRIWKQWDDFGRYWRWMVYPCLGIGVARSVAELLRFRTALEDVPILLIGGLIAGIQFGSFFVLVLALAISIETLDWTHSRIEGHWVNRRRALRPAEPFMVPTWRFRLAALVPASLVFLVVMAAWTFLTFVVPRQFESISDALDLFWSR